MTATERVEQSVVSISHTRWIEQVMVMMPFIYNYTVGVLPTQTGYIFVCDAVMRELVACRSRRHFSLTSYVDGLALIIYIIQLAQMIISDIL
jgi:hypothetical protein